MKNKKKLSVVACLAALVGTAGLGAVTASAETQLTTPATPASFQVVQAASVKAYAPFGIRYTAEISKADYDALTAAAGAEDVTYGMLVCPADYIDEQGKTLDFDETDGLTEYTEGDNYNGQFRNMPVEPSEVTDEEGNVTGYTFSVSISGILRQNISRPFAVRAYASSYAFEQPVYTDVFDRSIYTTATYVVGDKTNMDVNTIDGYLNDVINTVETVYTTQSVEIQSNARDFAYDMIHVGETFDVIGQVSNGVRTLESKATLKDMTNLEQVSGKTYKVTKLGAIDTTATVGKDDAEIAGNAYVSKESTSSIGEWVNPVVTDDKGTDDPSDDTIQDYTVSPDTGKNFGAKKWGSGAYPFSYVESYEGINDVIAYSGSVAKSARFITAMLDTSDIQGKYIYMDVNWAGNFQIESQIYVNGTSKNLSGNTDFWGAKEGALSAASTNSETGVSETVEILRWRVLSTLGEPSETGISSNHNKWMTLEFYVVPHEFHKVTNFVGIAFYRYFDGADSYFANFRVQDYRSGVKSVDALEITTGEKDAYERGDEIGFQVSYTDSLNRVKKLSAAGLTVEGRASINAAGNVEMGRFGDVTVSATALDTTLTKTLVGPTSTKVAPAEFGHGYGGYGVVDSSTITAEEKWLGHRDVAVYQHKGNGGYIGIGLGTEVNSLLTAGMNIYFDVLLSACNGVLQHLGGTIKYFDPLTGEAITAPNFNAGNHLTHGTGKWYRVAYEGITTMPTVNGKCLFGTYASSAATERTICVANAIVSSVSLIKQDGTVEPSNIVTDKADNWGEDGTINLMPHDKLGYYMWTGLNSGGPAPTSVYTKTTLGGEDCFEWLDAQAGTRFLCLNTAACRYLPVTGSIYSLEVYLTGEATLDFAVINTVDNVLNGGTKGYYSAVTCYDKATGTQLTSANLSLAENHNKWIVIEVAVTKTSYDPNPTRDGIGVKSIAEGAQIYFRNIQLRKTSQFA